MGAILMRGLLPVVLLVAFYLLRLASSAPAKRSYFSASPRLLVANGTTEEDISSFYETKNCPLDKVVGIVFKKESSVEVGSRPSWIPKNSVMSVFVYDSVVTVLSLIEQRQWTDAMCRDALLKDLSSHSFCLKSSSPPLELQPLKTKDLALVGNLTNPTVLTLVQYLVGIRDASSCSSVCGSQPLSGLCQLLVKAVLFIAERERKAGVMNLSSVVAETPTNVSTVESKPAPDTTTLMEYIKSSDKKMAQMMEIIASLKEQKNLQQHQLQQGQQQQYQLDQLQQQNQQDRQTQQQGQQQQQNKQIQQQPGGDASPNLLLGEYKSAEENYNFGGQGDAGKHQTPGTNYDPLTGSYSRTPQNGAQPSPHSNFGPPQGVHSEPSSNSGPPKSGKPAVSSANSAPSKFGYSANTGADKPNYGDFSVSDDIYDMETENDKTDDDDIYFYGHPKKDDLGKIQLKQPPPPPPQQQQEQQPQQQEQQPQQEQQHQQQEQQQQQGLPPKEKFVASDVGAIVSDDMTEEEDEEGSGYSSWHFVTIFLLLAATAVTAYLCCYNKKTIREGMKGYMSNGKKRRRTRDYKPLLSGNN